MKNIVFETPRLRGRDVSPSDAGFLTRLFGDKSNGVSEQGITREDVRQTIIRQVRQRGDAARSYWWIILHDDRARRVGLATLLPSVQYRGAGDIGIIIDRPFREIGYGSEAMAGLARMAFDVAVFRTAAVVAATANPDNVASARMLAGIGFAKGPLKRGDHWNGRAYEDSQHYTLARLALRP